MDECERVFGLDDENIWLRHNTCMVPFDSWLLATAFRCGAIHARVYDVRQNIWKQLNISFSLCKYISCLFFF